MRRMASAIRSFSIPPPPSPITRMAHAASLASAATTTTTSAATITTTTTVPVVPRQTPLPLPPSSSSALAAVVFDMDGTCTLPGAIDFAAMRRRCNVPKGVDIITHVEGQEDPHIKQLYHSYIEEEEELGLSNMKLQDGCAEVIAWLATHKVPRALLTRNNESAMHRTIALIDHPEAFHHLLSRSFTPCKPHPAAIEHLAEKFSLHPTSLIMIGDTIDDMMCGRRAGAATVLIGVAASQDPHYLEALPHADATVESFAELQMLLHAWLQIET